MSSYQDLEQRLEEKLNDLNSFDKSMNNIKEIFCFFKVKNDETRKTNKKFKKLSTLLKSIDTFFLFATTSSCNTLSLTRIGLIVIPITAATTCGFSIGKKVKYEKVLRKYNGTKKYFEKDQQTIKSFDKLNRKSLQENLIDKYEYESLCKVLTKCSNETKNEFCYYKF